MAMAATPVSELQAVSRHGLAQLHAGKPILFHSGILFDGQPSANHNRPGNFEALIEVKGLRFTLAHISWPWCEECVAVFGKFQDAVWERPELNVEMFIDVTPGTPPMRRRDALYTVFGYEQIEKNVLFGTDGRANDYHSEYAEQWIQRDREIYQSLKLSEETQNDIFSGNLKRFLGIT